MKIRKVLFTLLLLVLLLPSFVLANGEEEVVSKGIGTDYLLEEIPVEKLDTIDRYGYWLLKRISYEILC